MANTFIVIGSMVGSFLTIGGLAMAIIKWILKQNKQSEDIEILREQHNKDIGILREQHNKDIEEIKKKEAEDIQSIKDELCVISYAMLASLDGLMQLHCNGNVTKAHDRLEKHLNQQAHGQHRSGNS